MASDAWQSFFLPMLMADLQADARADARLAAAPPRLGCSLDVYCGLDDPSFPIRRANEWEVVAGGGAKGGECGFDVQFFQGGHGFLKECLAQILARVQNTLAGQHRDVAASAPARPLPSPSSLLHAVCWERCGKTTAGPKSPTGAEPCVVAIGGLPVKVTDEHVESCSGERGGLVIDLLGPIATATDLGSGEAGVAEDAAQCWNFIQFVQELVRRGAAGTIVLLAGQSARGAMAVGASKTVPLEWPELFMQRVFVPLPTAGSKATPVAKAYQAARLRPAETDLLLRPKPHNRPAVVLAARLRPLPTVPASMKLGLPASNGAAGPVYIITGGMGGIGATVVDWLIDMQGLSPTQLLILTRRQTTTPHPRGVTVATADVSDCAALLACDELRATSDVGGVFHLAGVLDDGLLSNMSLDRIETTARPKASGLANLRMLLAARPDWEPEFLLCFSSTSSLGGYPGQANYCAANACLDQLATWGAVNHAGPKVVSVNWGPWGGETGMVAPGSKAHAMSVANGEQPLPADQALGCLATVLQTLDEPHAPEQFAACDCDWAATPWAGMPLLEHVLAVGADNGSGGDGTIRSAADSMAGGDSGPRSGGAEDCQPTVDGGASEVVAFLRDRVPRWDTAAPLAVAGLDSLDTVSMRNSFNKQFKNRCVALPCLFFLPPPACLCIGGAGLPLPPSQHRLDLPGLGSVCMLTARNLRVSDLIAV